MAKSILVKLVSKYPQSYMGHKLLAEVYQKEGGMRRAIDEYVTAVDINKKDYKSFFKIADLLRDLGKKDEAIQMLEMLIKAKPDCYEGSCLLGELLCEQERFKEAANVYNAALIYNPGEFDLYYNLGIVYTRLSDFQMAKEMYEKAAAINHKMYGANYNLGLIAFIQRDYDTAEKFKPFISITTIANGISIERIYLIAATVKLLISIPNLISTKLIVIPIACSTNKPI